MGFSELLLDPDTSPAERERWLSFINRESYQLSSLIDNLLDVSRLETGRMRLDRSTCDLSTILPQVVDPFTATSSRHEIEIEVDPAARWVDADTDKLRQIITNLVSNAIKYSPNGGRIVIAACRRGVDNAAEISVRDQGMGIAPEHLARIFDRFQRVDGSPTRGIRGTGLGLYIVRSLVELHGGTIHVESQVGVGSTFRVTLPAAMSEVDATAQPALSAPRA
jgi:signal transduction histidine kinase